MGKHEKCSQPKPPGPLASPIVNNHTYLPVREDGIPGADGFKLLLDEQSPHVKAVNIIGVISSACEVLSFDPTVQVVCAYKRVHVVVAIRPNEAALRAGVTEPSPGGPVSC